MSDWMLHEDGAVKWEYTPDGVLSEAMLQRDYHGERHYISTEVDSNGKLLGYSVVKIHWEDGVENREVVWSGGVYHPCDFE